MSTQNGGPAFPTFQGERVYRSDADRVGTYQQLPLGGMSLRDYFAGQALAGMCANGYAAERFGLDFDSAADAAYRHANAMLKAREETDT